MGRKNLRSKTSNDDKKWKKWSNRLRFSLKSFFISRFASTNFSRVTLKKMLIESATDFGVKKKNSFLP